MLDKIFKKPISKEKAAQILKTNPEALEAFENSYSRIEDYETDNFFDLNSRKAKEIRDSNVKEVDGYDESKLSEIINDIVEELKSETLVWEYDGNSHGVNKVNYLPKETAISNKDLSQFPIEVRPELTGNLIKKDIKEPSYLVLIFYYSKMMNERNASKAKEYYDLFRQGLDILDFDPVMYEIVGMNKNSMGYWLPNVIDDITLDGFFKVPKTTIIKVPLPIIQLTRCDYMTLTKSTLEIVDKFVYDVCKLDDSKTYFIKTGTYSSKFDFRNARVEGKKEVRELGEYLLFIHFQANQMASPLSQPSIYGVSTTNEWVVREFIEDRENNMTIYHGLPLRTEYRVFIDFDSKEVLGINPYWDKEVMNRRFNNPRNNDDLHDYVTFNANVDRMMHRYNENKDKVVKYIKKFLDRNESMSGQWSMDIMQNGNDFWFIDMADAMGSALSNCVPEGKLRHNKEEWIPLGVGQF